MNEVVHQQPAIKNATLPQLDLELVAPVLENVEAR